VAIRSSRDRHEAADPWDVVTAFSPLRFVVES
jgi:hypothetical protein